MIIQPRLYISLAYNGITATDTSMMWAWPGLGFPPGDGGWRYQGEHMRHYPQKHVEETQV